jgi:tetratricopeptide (TPR) repeat protein
MPYNIQRPFASSNGAIGLVTFFLLQAALCSGSLAATCVARDPSAIFSAQLSLPPAALSPWIEVRDAIVRGDYKAVEDLLRTGTPSADQWFWRGVLLLHERKPFESIREFEQAARLKDSSQTETLLAVDYFLLNQRLLTEDGLNRALQLDPDYAMALYLRGRLNFVSDSFKKARRDFAAVLAKEPDDYHSLYYLGFSEWVMGQNVAAQKDLEHAVEVLACDHLNFPLAPYALAQIEFNAGDSRQALIHSDLALTMAESAPARNHDAREIAKLVALRGKIENHVGHSAEAERDFERAVKLNPYFAEGWYLLSRLYRKQGKRMQAARALKRFQQIQIEL